MTFSNRVYIYGVCHDGVREFITTDLDKGGARAYCHKFMRLFEYRFDFMIIGTIREIQTGTYEEVKP